MKKFNREKALIKIELHRKWQRYSRYVYIAIPCVLCGILGLYLAYSKFFVTQENDVVQTKVGDFVYGDVIINNYVNGQYTVEAPAKGTDYRVDEIVCDNGATGIWDNDDWGPTITNVIKRSKCNIYFVEIKKINIGNFAVSLDYYGLCPTVNDDGTVIVTEAESQYGYLCKAKDAYGDSYYYRGNVTNNYVKFANFYWRIIRINGDGTVRVIYDGTSAHVNSEGSADRQIGTTAFNSNYNDNAYVGYMYGKTGTSTYADTHANINNSTIKTYLDTWYENNIKGTTNEQYIVDNIFCNDRSFASNNSGTGAGTSTTYYRGYDFANNANNNKMMLTCPQKNDAFTVNDTSKGNGALTYGVGLVTIDEVVMAGGWRSNNSNYYVYSGQKYLTMSPSYFNGYAFERNVNSNGMVDVGRHSAGGSNYAGDSGGVRPVLNLSSDVLKNGNGTASDPYHYAS